MLGFNLCCGSLVVLAPSSKYILCMHTLISMPLRSRKTEFRRRDGDASAMHRNPERSGGSSCSVHGLEAFGRVVVQCPRPRRLSLDKDDVSNL
ncbi:unnamed protein product [Spirodela intermedia]|uniref:Uncharacterized protein n=1 Tax=Spirodela intermedia TaxID=51605 RepID=A0A7I8JVL8_SPIIN|nr:unnamed protein product [Spirodela intermedia]CAA6673683.1 unnamed protein product [Spirodela intermedia]